MRQKTRYCDYCGDDLGSAIERWDRSEIITCGAKECLRWERDEYAAREDEARHKAEQDGYSLYGGPGRW